jgi:hypothetical protein
VCETVRYYDHWVNGSDLRLVDLASGRLPREVPPACSHSCTSESTHVTLQLQPYENCVPPLPALDAHALAPIKHVLVHGSLATQDSCAFSDADIAVFVDDSRPYTQPQHDAAVRELRRLLHAVLAFDPLMHHGLMFASASALDCYDQRFLPVDTLARARVLHGARTLELHTVATPVEDFARTLGSCATSLRKQVIKRHFLRDDYRLKNFLSGALLMPARVLAASGTCVYKRESFALARSFFTGVQWEFIARCEALRATWRRPAAPFGHGLVPAASHPHLRQVIGQRLAPRFNVRRLSVAMIEGLIVSAHRFLDRVEAVI